MKLNAIEILKASKRLKEVVYKTPLIYSQKLSQVSNGEVYLKLENLQKTRSFKIRGAYNIISQLSEEEKKRGIITASSGNHGIAVAYISQILGLKAKIVMSKKASKEKINRCRELGAEVILIGENYDEAEAYCKKLVEKQRLTYISSYEDYRVIAGQGTIAYEILEQNPEIDTILVPVGGGGLISGIAIWAKALNPEIKVIGVQTTKARTMYESFKAKKVVELPVEPCIADGLAGKISPVTLSIVLKYVDDIILVDDDKLMDAVLWTLENEKQIVEPSGAVGIAAILQNKLKIKGKAKIAIVISGGNIDVSRIQY
ncbi:MAG: threonine/serine dehydratase [archaeon GB-1867-035]|nr:threonine/serine dehydratase [Candidatus Culexmicrobium profundum]